MSRDTSFTLQSTLDSSDSTEDQKSKLGEVVTSKLKYARNYYVEDSSVLDQKNLSEDFVNQLWKDFKGYRDSNDYVVMKQNNGHCDGSYFAMKLSKRGNDKYRREKKNRINALLEGLKTEDLKLDFSDKDYTKALFVTFTHNDKPTIKEAWESVSQEYEEVTKKIRQKYGDVSIFRVFEAYESGYPHVHAIILFHDHEFETFQHKGKTRIENKDQFAKICGWHSYIDVEGVDHVGKSIRYISKYFTKDSVEIAENSKELKKAKLTLAFNWLFRRRSFAVSGDFKEKLREFIHTKSNSHNYVERLRLFRFLEGVSFEFVTLSEASFLEIDRYENFVPLESKIKAKIDFEGECQ